jgi:hypothetical protein
MDRANELLDYYIEHPPAHLILGLVHLKSDQPKSRSRNDTHATSQLTELSTLMGQPPAPLPDNLRDMAEWALANSPGQQRR